MSEAVEKYNGVKFVRTDIEEGEDFTIVLPAEDIVEAYTDQFEIGNIVTSITLCEDGSILMKAKRVGGG